MNDFILALSLGYLLDRIFGDPMWLPHPICFIGKVICFLEKKLLRDEKDSAKFVKGIWLWFLTIFITFSFFGGILFIARYIDVLILEYIRFFYDTFGFTPSLYLVVLTIMSYQILATKSLAQSSKKVYEALKNQDLEEGRRAVSMIVGRDTRQLDEEGVIKATVETVAENTSDGVLAPMIFMALGGPLLGFIYKAVNTLDSMVGYKNDKYLYFGRFSAILDDAFNFIPARITAIVMILASYTLKLDWKMAIFVFKRDRFNHASPNSAQTESVCAGALRIRLAGDAYYFGKLYKKEFIGESLEEIRRGHIILANKLMYRTSFLFMAVLLAIFGLVNYFL